MKISVPVRIGHDNRVDQLPSQVESMEDELCMDPVILLQIPLAFTAIQLDHVLMDIDLPRQAAVAPKFPDCVGGLYACERFSSSAFSKRASRSLVTFSHGRLFLIHLDASSPIAATIFRSLQHIRISSFR